MHPCLRVPELLDVIFQIVQSEGRGNATIIALACTAKCFHDIALDTLWQTQASLVPLVKCFPDELLTETREEDGTRKLSFVKDPERADWTSVKMYAERIRIIRPDPFYYASYYGVLQLAGSAYLTLKRCIDTDTLLPNLRSLEWAYTLNSEPDTVASLPLMLNPKVSSMDIVLGNLTDQYATEIADAITSLEENTGNIRVVAAACPPIEEAVLALVSIRANRETSREILTKDRGGHFFPSLQTFTLYTDSLSICAGWLDAIRHTWLSSLTFSVSQAPPASALRKFFVKLTEHPAHGSLRKLHFVSTAPCLRGQSQNHIVSPETLSPLLQLNLTVLKLEPGGPIDIDDEYVVRMARAWPDLRILELNAEWRRHPVPRVTLAGLVPLAQQCPDVTALAMPISTDTTAFREEYKAGRRPTGGVSFKQCSMVGVGPSWVAANELMMIAGFLSDLCPDLMAVQTSWMRAGQPSEGEQDLDVEDQRMGEMWRDVERYGREMARIRRQERMIEFQ
ncbi:hypothetical protein C8Q74DRAFT_1369268 [Fomes fomentarius]|nr:hypothetical protein C8Q74DRAFT_1369268 [Fomes fomentarius]